MKLLLYYIKKNKKLALGYIILQILCIGIQFILPQFYIILIDHIIPMKRIGILFFIIILYILMLAVSTMFNILSYRYQINLIQNVSSLTRMDLVLKARDYTGEKITKIVTGDKILLITDDINYLEISIELFFNMIFSFSTILFSGIMIFYYNHWILISLLIFIPLEYIFNRIIALKIREKSEKFRAQYSTLYAIIEEYYSNLMTIRLIGAINYFIQRSISIINNYKIAAKDMLIYTISAQLGIQLLMEIPIIIVLFTGGIAITKNRLSVGELIAILAYTRLFIQPIGKLTQDRVEFINNQVRVANIEKELTTKSNHKGIKISTDKVCIRFSDATFYYNNNNNALIKNMNLEIKPSECITVIGKSGCGKSTLIKLLLGLWELKKGEIYINDIDIKLIEKEDRLRIFTVISQEVFIFDDTIQNNITMGTKISEKEFNRIIDLVGLTKRINSLSMKSETRVGEKGVKFSGGEKQRIAIARAIISNSPVIIFDEPTSSLDIINENLIVNMINKEFKGKTVIILSHKQKCLEIADKAYLMVDGKLKQIKTKKEGKNDNFKMEQIYSEW